MLRGVGIGAGDKHPPARDVCDRRPHLLPVEHPFVTVADRPGRQTGDVASRPRLGEQLAPHLFTREEGPEETFFLRLGAVGVDHRCPHAVTDDVEERGSMLGHGVEPFVDDRLEARREPQPAVALGEVHPGESEVELCAHERVPVAGRVVLAEQLLEPFLDERQIVVSRLGHRVIPVSAQTR